MTERPILFNGDMVRAILSGKKTQTRWPIKPPFDVHRQGSLVTLTHPNRHGGRFCQYPCPYRKLGDRLWVRESFAKTNIPKDAVYYRADDIFIGQKVRWIPSIHMPWALSCITLEITDISVRHVQDITEEQATAEGCPWSNGDPQGPLGPTCMVIEARNEFRYLWDTLYAASGLGWDANPLVWVVSFKRLPTMEKEAA